MKEIDIKQILSQADDSDLLPEIDPDRLASRVRRKYRYHKQIRRLSVIAAAGVLIISGLFAERQYRLHQNHLQIAQLQQEVKQLSRKAESTLALVQEVLAWQDRQARIDTLSRQLARYENPANTVESQIDETAYILVYQADRMVKEHNLKDAAIKNYRQVIRYFPETQWAETARERLQKLEQENQSQSI